VRPSEPPAGDHARVERDDAGHVVRASWPNGDQVTQAFDAAGRLLRRTWSDGDEERWAWDDAGHLLRAWTVSDGAWQTVDDHGWDDAGRYQGFAHRDAGRPNGFEATLQSFHSGGGLARIATLREEDPDDVYADRCQRDCPVESWYRGCAFDAAGRLTHVQDSWYEPRAISGSAQDHGSLDEGAWRYDCDGRPMVAETQSGAIQPDNVYELDAVGGAYGYDATGRIIAFVECADFDACAADPARVTDRFYYDDAGALLVHDALDPPWSAPSRYCARDCDVWCAP
jgi:YD repeat-containing protein